MSPTILAELLDPENSRRCQCHHRVSGTGLGSHVRHQGAGKATRGAAHRLVTIGDSLI
jgi:hypothetical protein